MFVVAVAISYLSVNPGDPGTTFYRMNFSSATNPLAGKGYGVKYLGTLNALSWGGVNALDTYFFSNMGVLFSLPKTAYINGLKLQIIVDYTELT